MFKRDEIPLSFAFELSNRCNYAQYHKECPIECEANPVFLDTDIIKETIIYFGSIKYNGRLYFNIYNEPLIDPRLFMLLEYNKKHCGCDVCLYTNGWNLDQYIVNELLKLNVQIIVSCYTDKEYIRLSELEGVTCSRIELDPKVKTIYESSTGQTGPCYFPSIYGMVNHKGEYILCCRDYEYKHVLGDLKNCTVKEVLESEYRQEVCDRLEVGDRFLNACKRCSYPGWGVEEIVVN